MVDHRRCVVDQVAGGPSVAAAAQISSGLRIAAATAAAVATLSDSGLFNQIEDDVHSNFKAITAKLQCSTCINNVNIEQAHKLRFSELLVCLRAH
jgi:cytochrome c-type biogenesis protein CcmH/NrfF